MQWIPCHMGDPLSYRGPPVIEGTPCHTGGSPVIQGIPGYTTDPLSYRGSPVIQGIPCHTGGPPVIQGIPARRGAGGPGGAAPRRGGVQGGRQPPRQPGSQSGGVGSGRVGPGRPGHKFSSEPTTEPLRGKTNKLAGKPLGKPPNKLLFHSGRKSRK